MSKTENLENSWRLKSFSISQDWSDKDKYSGSVSFENGEKDEIKFRLSQEQGKLFLDLLAPKIAESANSLVDKLLKSIK